ncbi:MAG: hypothetical protein ABI647_02885 [Gemmatimonadota bacterium]
MLEQVTKEPQVKALGVAIYAVGIMIVLVALGDFMSNVWPWRMGAVDWRYGSLGILSTFLVTPTLGMLIIVLNAAYLGHRGLLRSLGLICILGAAGLTVVVVAFLLDSLEVRRSVTEDAKWFTTISFMIAAAKHAIALVTLSLLGLGCLKASSRMLPRTVAAKAPRRGDPDIVVGKP